MKDNRGFTIIELMVSIAIFSLMITGMTIALMQQQKHFKLTATAVDMDETGRSALDFISSEIRIAGARQGKTFALTFVNGGSQPGAPCAAVNTTDAGTVDSPPDCIAIITWDITRGMQGGVLPSVVSSVELIQSAPTLVLQLPNLWFPPAGQLLNGDSVTPPTPPTLLGFRSRANLCSPNSGVDCSGNIKDCSDCGAVLRVSTVNTGSQTAEIAGSVDRIIAQNFQNTAYASFSDFITNDFVRLIVGQFSEMSIVKATTFSVNSTTHELQIEQDLNGVIDYLAGGSNAPGIMDLQLVFNLQDSDGGITKVGVPTVAVDRRFSDFGADPSLVGRQKDISTVEIYLLVRSKIRPQKITTSGRVGVKTITQLGDRLTRMTDHASLGEGFIYRIYTTTVYLRNLATEQFG